MNVRLLIWTMALVGVLSAPHPAHAQEVVLSGAVTDTTNAVLPGVVVTALHVDTGNTFVSVTDASGSYRIGAMRTGVYRITAELTGFTTVSREDIALAVGQNLVLNLKLVLGTVQETVTVTGAAPLVDTSQSRMATNIDPRQMQELPVNGRDWLQLVVMSPGSRQTTATNAPVAGAQGTDPGIYQLNLDGQQVTQTMAQSGFGQPRFSRDAIAEFQYISSRFDATQGRSSGVQVNAVTKSGTNQFRGTVSGYIRDDKFNAKDFIAQRVLAYSNQQFSATFGGPIKKDRVHFFGNYEGEREPRTIFFTSVFPRFNIGDMLTKDSQHVAGARMDWQASNNTRLMMRGNAWIKDSPIAGGGGPSSHPSTLGGQYWRHYEIFTPVTTVIGSKTTNEFKPGFIYHTSDSYSLVPNSPRISLRGYTIGAVSNNPLRLILHTYTARDDFTTVLNRHEIKMGGEFLWQPSAYLWSIQQRGTLDATRGAIPANIEDLFLVWNDPSTWNLRPLSANAVRWSQSFGTYSWGHNQPNAAGWVQDNWAVNQQLTLNLGVRWDLAHNWGGQNFEFLPLRQKADNEWANFGPRLGFAYQLPGDRTVIRGGWGKYFLGPKDQWAHHIPINQLLGIPSVPYDGRADFAVNPFNGPSPSLEAARAAIQDTVGWIASDTVKTPYSWQTSIGLQRQLGETIAVQADYVWVGGRRNEQFFNTNLTYNPATGVNYPWTDLTRRRWSDRGITQQVFSLRNSDYHGLETSFSKRFTNRWQTSVAYTLAGTWDEDPRPNVFDDFPVTPDLGGERSLASGDYRHRLVSSGIWSLPYDFQLSGIFTYRSAARSQETWGQDVRNRGTASGRLRPDGTIIPRTAFLGDDIRRADLKIQRTFRLGRQSIEGSIEVFNVFNTASYGYVTNQASASYLQRSSGGDPRTLQLGWRYQF